MRAIFLALALATPVAAQSLDPRYEEIGQFEGALGEAALSLKSLYDREKDRSMIRLSGSGSIATVSIGSRSIGDDGTPTNPGISFTIGPLGAGGTGVRSDIFYNDATGYYVADADNGNRADLADFVLDDTSVSFSVTAGLLPVKRGEDGFVLDDARSTLSLTGTYSGKVASPD